MSTLNTPDSYPNLPCILDRKGKKPTATFSFSRIRMSVCLASCVLLLTGMMSPGQPPLLVANQNGEKTPADTSQKATDPSSNLTRKLIPNQKAFLGSPDTSIDLSTLFYSSENNPDLFPTGTPLTLEILRNGKDVADATIVDKSMTLKWGKKTAKKREILIRATDERGATLDTKFAVELWEPNYWKLAFTVLGGLGIFLLGMKNLSEGMQAIAGNGLRRVIGLVTNHRLMATGVGVFVTMLVQSSSITTVMVVGFVNSGFMTLSQAVGVIMGANIGTTITGWILVLKIGKYGLPLAGAAAFFYLFSKRDRIRYFALTALGLGMLFLGLELMKDGFGIIKELPRFEAWFKTFNAGSYIGILKCAMVGCVLTFIVQSSSATLGITIGLAQLGVIEFETASALVLGENIGTTITAWLASFGASVNAKRAAYFHVLFNIIGVAWITCLFSVYMNLIRYVVMGDTGADMTLGAVSGKDITMGIAAVHTGFNITNTLAFLPFAGYLARLLERFVPDKNFDSEDRTQLTSLDIRMLESPVVAAEQSRSEVQRMASSCQLMMEKLKVLLKQETPDPGLADEILEMEDQQDKVQEEIVTFMSNLLAGNVPHTVVDEARRQLRMADEYESVSDCIATVLKASRQLTRRDLELPEVQREELAELHDMVSSYLKKVSQVYVDWTNSEAAIHSLPADDADLITKQSKILYKRLLEKDPEEQLETRSMVAYNRQVAAYRRIRDHLLNISEALTGDK
jgi:phosphate:Na+ symporter